MNTHWMYLEPTPPPGQRSTLPINATDEVGRPIKHPVALELIDIIPLNKNNNPIVNITPMHQPELLNHNVLLTLGHTHDVKINWYLTHERTQFVLLQYAKDTTLNIITTHNLKYPIEVIAPLRSYSEQHNATALDWLNTIDSDGTLQDRLVRSSLHAILHSTPHNAAALATQNSMRLHKHGSKNWWEQRNQNNTRITALTHHAHEHYPAPTPANTTNHETPPNTRAPNKREALLN